MPGLFHMPSLRQAFRMGKGATNCGRRRRGPEKLTVHRAEQPDGGPSHALHDERVRWGVLPDESGDGGVDEDDAEQNEAGMSVGETPMMETLKPSPLGKIQPVTSGRERPVLMRRPGTWVLKMRGTKQTKERMAGAGSRARRTGRGRTWFPAEGVAPHGQQLFGVQSDVGASAGNRR